MNLDQFVTQDNADAGVWTPVTLYGKPADFDLLILGDDSDAVQQFSRKALKKLKRAVGKGNQIELDDETIDELASDTGDEAVLVRIAGIRGWSVERNGSKETARKPEPVMLGNVELKNDTASYKLLIAKIPAVKNFVLEVSRDRTNFLSKPSGN